MVANAIGYLFVGPLFYFATRPTFKGVSIVLAPGPVAACKDTVYYLDKDKHVCPRRRNMMEPRNISLTAVLDVRAGAEAGDSGKPALPRFSMVAYTDGVMKVGAIASS